MENYSKRRQKVIRRLKVLSQNKNFGMGAKSNIQYMIKQLPPESQIRTERQCRGALEALRQAETSDLYSVTGQRRIAKRKMKKLAQYGLNIKTYKELDEFTRFMEDVRDYSVAHIYDSTKALELYMEREKDENSVELLDKYREWQRARR